MAQTYTISTNQQLGNNKTLLTIFNGSGSGRIIRVYKIWCLHNPFAAATSTLTKIHIIRTTANSSGTDIKSSLVKHQTANENMPSQVAIKHSSTDTTSGDPIRQVTWSVNTPASIGIQNTIGEWQSVYSLSRVFEAGYYNSTLEPIVLREDQGIVIKQPGTNTNGFVESIIEFTMESS